MRGGIEDGVISLASGDYVVYPTHGVGRVLMIDKSKIGDIEIEFVAIRFDQEKMTLRVPVGKVQSCGVRKLSSPMIVETALKTLKGRAKAKSAMWCRRAQEYESKINSGDLVSIAEVVRDLHRRDDQPDRSYSERQLYESALERLTRGDFCGGSGECDESD